MYRAAVFDAPGQEPALETQSSGVTALARTTGLPAGGFDITFAQSISGCTWTGSVSTVRGSALTPVFAPFVVWPTRPRPDSVVTAAGCANAAKIGCANGAYASGISPPCAVPCCS